MGDKSAIEWCDATWNPVVGCTRVSPGCDHCYAFQLHDQRHLAWKRGRWPDAPTQYHQPFSRVQTIATRLDQPLRWSTPRRVFVNSLSDLFHPAVPDDFIELVFGVMAFATQHTFQILTKRPERMRTWINAHTHAGCAAAATHHLTEWLPKPRQFATAIERIGSGWPWPLPNVWLGVSVEDAQRADERIPLLVQTPAAVRFLSCEPLLEPVNLGLLGTVPASWGLRYSALYDHLHWVIAGGESGPKHRPFDADWARMLRDECQAAGVAFFFKQHGGRTPKAAGRELDGRTWDEFPAVRALAVAR